MGVTTCDILIINIIFLVLCNSISTNSVNRYVAYNDLGNGSITDTLPSLALERNGDTYYYISGIYKGNYYQATQFCNINGMSLVSIETEAENEFLFQSLKNYFTIGEYLIWTSGTTLSENYWTWLSTGRPIIYASWLPSQPDNAGKNEKCLELRFSRSTKTLMWNDHACDQPKYAICERKVSKSISNLANNFSSCNLTLINVPSQ